MDFPPGANRLITKTGASPRKGAMPVLDVGERLTTPSGRIDLARDAIGVMLHPKDVKARRRRQSALAMTLLGMRDRDDEPEALAQVKSWFKQAGGFKTASQSDPYSKQQMLVLKQLPHILVAGSALHLVWVMQAHHRTQLAGGASLSKAIAIIHDYPVWHSAMSERSLWTAWSRYKSVAHLCAAFTFVFHEALETPAGESDERLKTAYDQDLHITLSLAAAYERFASNFRPHGNERPLLDPGEIWLLRGIQADETFIPPPLLPEMLAVAERHQALVNVAYRCADHCK
jgi:hypothetical protein